MGSLKIRTIFILPIRRIKPSKIANILILSNDLTNVIYICMLVICLFMFENRREKNKDVKSMKKYTICALVLYKWKFRLNCEIHTSWNDLNICFSLSNTSKSEILNLILRKQKIVLIFSLSVFMYLCVCVCKSSNSIRSL